MTFNFSEPNQVFAVALTSYSRLGTTGSIKLYVISLVYWWVNHLICNSQFGTEGFINSTLWSVSVQKPFISVIFVIRGLCCVLTVVQTLELFYILRHWICLSLISYDELSFDFILSELCFFHIICPIFNSKAVTSHQVCNIFFKWKFTTIYIQHFTSFLSFFSCTCFIFHMMFCNKMTMRFLLSLCHVFVRLFIKFCSTKKRHPTLTFVTF